MNAPTTNPPLKPDLADIVAACEPSPDEGQAKFQKIHEEVLARSHIIKAANFSEIGTCDLELLFGLYDEHFFEGSLRKKLTEKGHPIEFEFSRRMTAVPGKTEFMRDPATGVLVPGSSIRIIISLTLLWQSFHDEKRAVTVEGLPCPDRLEALQRVFEHELVHLAELLVWGDSKCPTPRFQSIARSFFGHTECASTLVTQQERAWDTYGIHRGAQVSFEHEGRRYAGVVNRITKRATVLVEDSQGAPYSNGKRYKKFLVPLAMLQAIPRA